MAWTSVQLIILNSPYSKRIGSKGWKILVVIRALHFPSNGEQQSLMVHTSAVILLND